MGLLGFWGEWHTYPHTSWIPADTKRRVIGAFAAAFNTTQLQLRYPNDYKTAADRHGKARFGLHDDSFSYSARRRLAAASPRTVERVAGTAHTTAGRGADAAPAP